MCDTAALTPEKEDIPSGSGFVNPAVDDIQITELNLEHNWNEPRTFLGTVLLGQYDQSKDRQQAVSLRHAHKSYDNSKNPNYILKNLNMTVAKGSIYGLLGASGCGKTTLLSCIVGRRNLDSGEILVLGSKPGTKGSGVPGKRVGYMPQEIALFGEFTIRETMMYFGWIFDMVTNQIDDKMHFLLKFLDLPPEEQFVKNLSGGQQRRVSFAVALIHDPELLILDEPTVGVDPLLRQDIWDHLVRLTITLNKTVIITTHYIEEARQAHTIGLMRSGKLLAEKSPQALLTTYNCPTLEEVFFKLSREQGENTEYRCRNSDNFSGRHDTTNIIEDYNNLSNNTGSSNPVKVSSNSNLSTGSYFTSTGKMKALLKKNWLRIWRNIGMMMIIFALPVIQVNLFCLSIGRDPIDLKLAIVNHEINWRNESCPVEENCRTLLSCIYLNNLDSKTIIKEYYETLELANDAIRKGNVWGTLYITENFTRNLIMLSGKNSNNQSDIHVWLDISNQQIGFSLTRIIQSAYQNFIMDFSEACHVNIEFSNPLVEFEDPIFGSENTTFTSFLAPGIILSIIFFLALSLTSSALILERTEGLLDRSWVAGVSAGEILLSHIITQFVTICIQTVLIYLFVILVYGVECNGNIAWVLILTLLQGHCGMCFGFLISSICEHERNATQLALGSFYPMLMLSGIIWPEEGMPMILRCTSKFLPLTLATSSLRSMMSRGWSITDSGVYIGFISTITWIVVFLTMSMCFLKFKRS